MTLGRRSAFVATIAIFLVSPQALAQRADVTSPAVPAPKTKLEAFTGATGTISIKGYQDVGKIESEFGKISVTAMSFRNPTSGQSQAGIAVEVAVRGRFLSPTRSFIDYDEIQGLVDGLDYLLKLPPVVSDYPFFEASYLTRGDVSITVFNNNSGVRQAVVKVSRLGSEQVFVSLEQLAKFKDMIRRARGVIDNPAADARKAEVGSEEAATPQVTPAPPAPPRSSPKTASPKPTPKTQTKPAPLPLR